MLETDENLVEYLEEHFKDVRVSCQPRPDGALLVTLAFYLEKQEYRQKSLVK